MKIHPLNQQSNKKLIRNILQEYFHYCVSLSIQGVHFTFTLVHESFPINFIHLLFESLRLEGNFHLTINIAK